jgi:hypothetical protein
LAKPRRPIAPIIGQTLPLERAADAHAAIEQRSTIGKTRLARGSVVAWSGFIFAVHQIAEFDIACRQRNRARHRTTALLADLRFLQYRAITDVTVAVGRPGSVIAVVYGTALDVLALALGLRLGLEGGVAYCHR